MFDLNSDKNDNIDHDKLSRQIRTYGIEITKILSKLKILIVGLRGYGVEIAKNIILSNPYKVAIFDEGICKINDLGCNYFLTSENVTKKERRDEACLKKLSDLNPATKVYIEQDYISKIKDFDVVIITEITNSEIINKINKECHENNKGFIYTYSLGLTGLIFSDFGESHVILDKTGKEKAKIYISDITREKKGKLKLDFKGTNKRLNDEGYLIFKEVEGMTELNSAGPVYYEANPDNFDEFFIGDTSNFGKYLGGGIVEQYFYPCNMKYKTFEENLIHPNDNMMKFDYSMNKIGRKQLLHLLFIIIQKYYDKNKCLPELNNENEAQELYNQVIEFSKTIDSNNEFYKGLPDIEKNEKLIKDTFKFARSLHPSLCSFLGGIVAQEAIKFTGLYCPLNQWLWFDIYDETIINLENPNRTLLNSRYDDLISIYGQEFVEKMQSSNMFLVGAGAVGCEYLKILALMGIGSKNNSKVTVTDNDCIENSNLNRQFLFRKEHIGKSKSLVACEEVKKINPEFNCESLQIEVREETEDVFNENFYKKQKFVLIAVDNVKARKYINNQCTFHRVNLIECGTLGENASSQLIIPFVSEEYKGVENNANQPIGICTIRNLPSLIEHCIEWSRDKFFEYFGKNIRILKNFLESPKEFFEENTGSDLYEKLIYLKYYIILFKSKSYDKCLTFAKKIFYLNYKKIINDILIINPPDKILENGTKFWKGSNRLPHLLEYNPDDETNFYYIEYFAYLLADSLDIPYNSDINYKKKFLKLKAISMNDELYLDIKTQNSLDENLNKTEKLKLELLQLISEGISDIEKIHEQLFEKDHDENHQIDFIYISSNLRASNFNIEFCSRDKVKFISGNIVPSIPTTTSSIVGFISSQIYTLLQSTDINNLRQINIDLSTPFFCIHRPKVPFKNKDRINPETNILTKVIPPNFTCWDYYEVEGNKTVEELLDFINEKYSIEVNGLYSLNDINLIKNESDLGKDFLSNYLDSIGIAKKDDNENVSKRNVYFKILADEKDNEDIHVKMPKFKYISK